MKACGETAIIYAWQREVRPREMPVKTAEGYALANGRLLSVHVFENGHIPENEKILDVGIGLAEEMRERGFERCRVVNGNFCNESEGDYFEVSPVSDERILALREGLMGGGVEVL